MMTDALINGSDMYRKLMEAGEEWADAKSAYQALDDATKSVLADLANDYRESLPSRVEREEAALRCAPYREHLASVSRAHKAFLRAQVRYDSLRTLIELRRSEESTRRAEMRL